MNRAIELDDSPLARLSAVFSEVDKTFLMTYVELDHFPDRRGAEYRGAVIPKMGEAREWPATQFPKVLVYSREFPVLGRLLDFVNRSQLSAAVVGSVCPPALRQQFGTTKLHFLDKPFDLESVAAACDLAITNGNHGTTAACLLAGKPVLVVPTVTEQHMLGERVEVLGAGLLARPDDLEAVIGGLVQLLREDSFRNAAGMFQERYASVRSEDIVSGVVASIERCVGAA